MTKKEQIVAGFSRGARTYCQRATLQTTVAEQLAHRLQGVAAQRILEIGCGTGLFSQRIVQRFPTADLLFTDISVSMIEQCQHSFRDTTKTEFICLDGEALDKLPSSFDLIASSMTMHWFQELSTSLQTIKAKLNTGGRLVFAMLGENSLYEWRDMCQQLNYPIATPHFPSSSKLKKQFPELHLTTEVIRETYPNAYQFLKTFKSLGATATRAGYQPLNTAKMRNLLKTYAAPIHVSYEIIYGEYCAQ